jgi:hypothetical protein
MLTLLCLVSSGVAVFLYLELSKMKRDKQGKGGSSEPTTTAPQAMTAMRPGPSTAMRARPAMIARPRPMTPDPRPADPTTPDPMTPDSMAAPASAPGAVRSVPRTGKPKANEIELLTAPTGVSVIHDKRLLGITPIRLRAKRGKRYLLVLNKEGYKVKAIKPKFSRFAGLRHRVTLGSIVFLARKGTTGQTRIDVRCRTPRIYRVFLNGRDTGRNCPTTLKVSRGPNAPGIYLPDRDRVTFKKIKSIPQKSVTVEFAH